MKARDFFKYAAKPFNIVILLCVIIFIILFAEVMLAQIFVSFTEPAPSCKQTSVEWKIQNAGKDFTPDGRLLLTEDEDKTRKIYDANYTLLWEGKKKNLPEEYKTISWSRYPKTIRKDMFINRQRLTPDMSRYLEIPIRQNKKIKEVWRYLPDKNIFEGFEFKGEKFGFFSPNGFNQLPADRKQSEKPPLLSIYVPKDSENPILIWQTKYSFYAIDIENRKIETLFDSKEEITYICYKNWKYDNAAVDANYRSFVCYATKDGHINLILNETGEQIIITPPKDWNKYLKNSVSVTATKDSILLYHYTTDVLKPRNYDKNWRRHYESIWNKPVNFSTELYKVDKDDSLNLINNFKWTRPVYTKTKDNQEYYLGIAKVFSPSALYVMDKIIANLPDDIDDTLHRDEDGMMRGYAMLIIGFKPKYEKICMLISFTMMLFTLWHGWARKNNRFSLALWAILVGLFNIAGLLTYLALNHTTTIKCPSCGKKRNLEKPECIRCDAKLPEAKSLVIAD